MKGKITTHFSWEEMVGSRTAQVNGIANRPGTSEMVALERLVVELLQPLRDIYGKPIRISSGYRCAELNRLVGGVPSSQHLKGEAADCVVEDPEELLNVLLKNKIPFDQAILYRRRNFLHLSIQKENKNRGRVILLSLFTLLMLPGCGIKQTQQATGKQNVTLEQLRTEELKREQLTLRTVNRNAFIRHIHLTPPDSSGRQQVESVSEIRIEETGEQQDSIYHQSERKEETSVAKVTEHHLRQENKTNRKIRWWFPLLFIAAGTALWLRWHMN